MTINPATPGTIVVLAATVLLVLVTVSVPVSKSFYFLTADLSGSSNNVSLKGTLSMGCFGYCLKTSGQDLCSKASLGYSIDAGSLLGISDSRINKAIDLDGISDSVIKGLSYVLILHPIAAGFAGIATISGLVSHIREFSGSCFTTCFASFGATFAILAFVFDIIVFSIAKSRIDGNSSLQTSASLGNAVWMTLAAAILLLFSGCFFCAGRCCLRRRRRGQDEADRMRPQGDLSYADRMRSDAEYAEKRRNEDAMSMGRNRPSNVDGSLPAFAEFGNEETRHEAIPLKSMDEDDDDHSGRYQDGTLPYRQSQNNTAEAIGGVGMGYGRRDASPPPPPRHPSLGPRTASPPLTSPSSGRHMPFVAAANVGQPQSRRQGTANSSDPYANLPSHVEPAAPYMSPPPGQNLDEDLAHGDHDSWRRGNSYDAQNGGRQGSLPMPGSGAPVSGGGAGGFHRGAYAPESYHEADVATLASHSTYPSGGGIAMPGSFGGGFRSPTSEGDHRQLFSPSDEAADTFSTRAPTYTSRQLPQVPQGQQAPSRWDNRTPGGASSAAGTMGHQGFGSQGQGQEYGYGEYDKRGYPYAESEAPPSYR